MSFNSFISDRVESHTMSGCGMGEDVSSINHVVNLFIWQECSNEARCIGPFFSCKVTKQISQFS